MIIDTKVDVQLDNVHYLVITGMECGDLATFQLDEGDWMAACAKVGEKDAFAGIKISVRLDDDEPHEDDTCFLTDVELQQGLQRMARKYPRHFADFMAENDDAITGDVFLQCVVLGEVIYG